MLWFPFGITGERHDSTMRLIQQRHAGWVQSLVGRCRGTRRFHPRRLRRWACSAGLPIAYRAGAVVEPKVLNFFIVPCPLKH